jgi:flagellar biosynthesis protein FlhB
MKSRRHVALLIVLCMIIPQVFSLYMDNKFFHQTMEHTRDSLKKDLTTARMADEQVTAISLAMISLEYDIASYVRSAVITLCIINALLVVLLFSFFEIKPQQNKGTLE